MNRYIFASFSRHENPSDQFAVGTYHNPCLFGSAEKVKGLAIHTSWLVTSLAEFAGPMTPRILCGDFNFSPTNSRVYEWVTTAKDEIVEDLKIVDERPVKYQHWTPDFDPLDSAYVLATGKEPELTNYASASTNDLLTTRHPLRSLVSPKQYIHTGEIQHDFIDEHVLPIVESWSSHVVALRSSVQVQLSVQHDTITKTPQEPKTRMIFTARWTIFSSPNRIGKWSPCCPCRPWSRR